MIYWKKESYYDKSNDKEAFEHFKSWFRVTLTLSDPFKYKIIIRPF